MSGVQVIPISREYREGWERIRWGEGCPANRADEPRIGLTEDGYKRAMDRIEVLRDAELNASEVHELKWLTDLLLVSKVQE